MKFFSNIFIIFFIIAGQSYGQGNSYCGTYKKWAPIVLFGKHDTIISGLSIANSSGDCITLNNCYNITIQKCKLGPAKTNGITLNNCTNITVSNCSIQTVSTGVAANSSNGINISFNDVKNVQGPFPSGQMVRFNNVKGGNNRINYNVGENILGQSMPEDEISLYMSSGIATDPIQVIGNWIRGGGPSMSGGGIMAGDNGGSYILVQNNKLVNPGQYGISISSGTNITINGNSIYAKKQAFTNTGIYIWNQYTTTSACSSNTVSNNIVNWTDKNGLLNGSWNQGNCGPITGWATNNFLSKIDSTILPSQIIGRQCPLILGAESIVEEDQFAIFSNPAEKTIFIQNHINHPTSCKLYNINGQQVMVAMISDPMTKLEVSHLPPGIYFMLFTNTKGITKSKIILE